MRGPVVITGGGTAGHVFPMQAVGDALLARGLHATELRYVGSRRGQEAQLLGGSIPLTLLPGRGLRRSVRPRDVAVSVRAALSLVGAVVIATVSLRRWRAAAVVSVGGYASFACCVAAWIWRVPLVLVELDATPGLAQRVFARYAAVRCCAFDATGTSVVVTGAPIRSSIENLDRRAERVREEKLQWRPPLDAERCVVVVMTGSLGSSRVNEAVAELAHRWRGRNDVALLHVTGRRDYHRYATTWTGELDYRVFDFADMEKLWSVCDVAICRAGAATLSELCALAIPAVLVPLPGMNHHQSANARAVVDAGGALLIADAECRADTLDATLGPLLGTSRLRDMGDAAHTLSRPRAAAAIATEILKVRAT